MHCEVIRKTLAEGRREATLQISRVKSDTHCLHLHGIERPVSNRMSHRLQRYNSSFIPHIQTKEDKTLPITNR